jgi:hypothetical protein
VTESIGKTAINASQCRRPSWSRNSLRWCTANLQVHGGLKDWPALKHETESFLPEVTPGGRETWNAARSGHDDLLTAAALCAWYAQMDDMNSWGFYELARMRAQRPEDTHESFVCAIDIGQSSDPTAVCVMSRLDDEDPRRDFFEPVLPPQPESEVDGAVMSVPKAGFATQTRCRNAKPASGERSAVPWH